MKPDYQIFIDSRLYSSFLSGFTGETLANESVFESGKVLPRTLELIKEAWKKSVPQTKALANHLRSDSFRQSCFNIYHFVTSNIPYKKDKPGMEEIRTASRSWNDRAFGVDCEDYAIFIGSLLTNMGFEPRFEVVGFSPSGQQYSHIFCVAHHQGESIPIDTTPYMDGLGPVVLFSTRPQGITSTMELKLLNGLAGNFGIENPSGKKYINGLGGIGEVTPLTQLALDEQTEAINRFQNKIMAPDTPSKFRKARVQVMLNGLPEASLFHGVGELIDDINGLGELVIKPGVSPDDVGALIGVLNAWGLLGFRDDATMAEIEGLGGLEFDRSHPDYEKAIQEGISGWFSRTFNKVKNTIKKGANAISTTVKSAAQATGKAVTTAAKATSKAVTTAAKATGKGVVKFVKNPLYYINKINPATIILRNSLLLLLRINLFKTSSRLKYGYLTEEQVRAKGWNVSEHSKLRKQVSTLEEIFDKLGGEKVNLKSAIVKGGGGIGELGEPATATAATTASAMPLILKIVQALKSINFSNLFGGKATQSQLAETVLSLDEENSEKQRGENVSLNADEKEALNKEIMDAKADPSTFNNPDEVRAAFELARQAASKEASATPVWLWPLLIIGGGLTLYAASK